MRGLYSKKSDASKNNNNSSEVHQHIKPIQHIINNISITIMFVSYLVFYKVKHSNGAVLKCGNTENNYKIKACK